MKIAQIYSHQNGFEWIRFHRRSLWSELVGVITSIDATKHRRKRSKERSRKGKMLYAPKTLNAAFEKRLRPLDWVSVQANYAICDREEMIRQTLMLPYKAQRTSIQAAGLTPIKSYNQTDFVKKDVAVEVQFGKYAFIAYDLFVKHLAFFVSGDIKVGVEILPMKSMQVGMSSGPGYFEWALYNIVRQGRGVPAVPLVIIGVAP